MVRSPNLPGASASFINALHHRLALAQPASAPTSNAGVYLVVVYDRSIATTNSLGRVCDSYIFPIIERLKQLAATNDAQIARVIYTKTGPQELSEQVSYKTAFVPFLQATASIKAGASGQKIEPLGLSEALTLALQILPDQTKLSNPRPIFHILVITSHPPHVTHHGQSHVDWARIPPELEHRGIDLSMILLSPPNPSMVEFFGKITALRGEATAPWFPVKSDQVYLSGLSSTPVPPPQTHVAAVASISAQPIAPQPQAGKKRRREEDDDADYVDDEQGSSSPRGSPKRRRSIRKGGTGRGGSTSTATTSHSPKSSPASSGRTVVNSTYVAPTQGGSGSGAAPESSSSKSRGARASRLVNRIARQPLPQGPTPAVPTGTTASQAPADASEPVLPLSPPDMAGGDWPISFSVQGDQLLSVVDPHASSSWDIPQPPPPLQEFRTEGDIDKFFDESPDADIDAYFNDGTLIRRVQRPMLASSNWDVQQLGGTNDNAGEQAPLLPPKKETSSPPTAATISGIPPGQFQDSTSPSAPEDLSPPRQPKQALGRPFHPISPPSRESRVPSSDIPLTSSASYPSLLSNIPALPSPRRHPSLAQASSSSPRTPSGTRLSLQSSRSQHQASPRPAAGPMSLPSVPQIGSGNNAGEAQGQRPSSRAAQLPPAVPSQLGGSPPALVQSQGQALPQPQRVAQLGQAPQQLRYPPAEIQSNYPVGVGGYRPAPSTMSQTQAQQYTAAHQLGGAYLSPRRAALQQSSPMSQSVQIAGTPGSTTTISGHGSPSVVTPTPSGPLLASGLAGIDGPAPVGSFSVPSSTPQEVSAANRREKNVPHYPSANLVGGTTSKISLTIAIETDGLFYDGPAHKRLRVPITVISAPTSNVRTDLWPKPSFQLTPGSMSGPIVWRDFFAFLEEHSIPTCSLRANTRTAGGIKAFELEYLASFDRICRYMIDQQCFARVPFRVPGGPAGAGIALFPSIGEHFSSAGVVSLHAAFFGKMDIPAASDFKQTYSPASDTEQQYGGGSAVLEATGSPGGPVQGFSSSAPQPSTPYPPLGAYRGVPTPVGASPYPQFYAPSTVGPPTMTANPYPPGPHIQPMHPLRSHSLDTAPSTTNYPAPHRASTYGIAPTLQAGQPSEVSIHSPPRMAPATAHALAQNHQPRYQHAASDMAGATPTLTQTEPGRGLTQHQATPTVWTTPPVTLSPDAQSQLSTLPNMSGQQQGYPAPLGYSSYPYPVAPSAVPVYQPIGDTGGDGGAGFSPAADAAMSQYFSFSPPQWATPGAAGASGQSMSPQHYPSGVPTSMGTNVNITTSTTTPPTTMMTSPDRHFVQPSNPETQLTLSESPASSSYLQHDYPHTQQVHSQQQHYPHLYPQSTTSATPPANPPGEYHPYSYQYQY